MTSIDIAPEFVDANAELDGDYLLMKSLGLLKDEPEFIYTDNESDNDGEYSDNESDYDDERKCDFARMACLVILSLWNSPFAFQYFGASEDGLLDAFSKSSAFGAREHNLLMKH
ncbi:11875_t:CDS:2 [Ambispora gerdemannii]|uniref:11875_t:CDS:1 n=1 Tax=Ambispora gerdemannii TaxID=144530 RepID=A0A9N9E8S2_9GLOM|nr:11875_t:CDS:2 [Ambispora gerdemannii]